MATGPEPSTVDRSSLDRRPLPGVWKNAMTDDIWLRLRVACREPDVIESRA